MNSKKSTSLPFTASDSGTTGVEMEWITVDQNSGAQIPIAPRLLKCFPESLRIKQELFTSTVEINTNIHSSTAGCLSELSRLRQEVLDQLQAMDGTLLSSGTHPFSRWRDQQVSDDTRYFRLLERLQWMAHRFNIFGIHVHIGMPSGDACIHVMNQLLPISPVFLAISANSPFWQGDDTGLASSRVKIFEGLSQGGMPFYFQNWRDFEHCAGRLLATGSIDSVRDIWWEMRPHPDFGTLEVRIGDMPASKEDSAAYIAYVRAEAITAIAQEPARKVHPSLIRENRWRACRYGLAAEFIDPVSEEIVPVLDWLENRLSWLERHGAELLDINTVRERLDHWQQFGDGASRQRRLLQESGSMEQLIRQMHQHDGWNI